MAMEDEARPEIYYIPENFEDAGGVLGGHFSTRNAIELCVLCGPLAVIEYKIFFGGALHIGIQTSIIIMLFTIVPLAALAAFGIGGESLSQILMAYIRFSRKRRKLSYIEFSDLKSAAVESITFDMILDAFSAGGFKGIKKLFQDHKAAMANASTITAEEEEDFDRDEVIEDEEFEADAPEVTDSNGHKFSKPNIKLPKTERRKAPKKKAQFMDYALKEVLLKKFELGEDDEEY